MQSPGPEDSRDRLGFEENENHLGRIVGALLPQAIARRAIGVVISADRTVATAGERIELTIVFKNRLPCPITLTSPERRLWGWTVDGRLEAGAQQTPTPGGSGTFEFDTRERKAYSRTWDGRFLEAGDTDRWVLADPGDYEVTAFVNTGGGRRVASTTVTIQ